MKLWTVLSLLVISFSVHANGLNFEEDYYEPAPQKNLRMDTLNISGSQRRARVTAADKMRRRRRMLEKRNEMMLKKKMEQTRFQAELRMMKSMQKAFDRAMKNMDQM